MDKEKFLKAIVEREEKIDALEFELNALYFDYCRRRYGTAGVRGFFGALLCVFKKVLVLRCRNRFNFCFRLFVFAVFLLVLVDCFFFPVVSFLFYVFGGL